MSEFIGSRISLISKSDIRYVGTLHDINSENSTVALENVSSFGTEGRRGKPDDEVPPSDQVYEYIVFRGSDVKDLRFEEPPKESKPLQQPQVPDDPAILGSSRPKQNGSHPVQQPPQDPRQQQSQTQFQQPPPYQYQQFSQYPQQRFGGTQGGPGPGFQGPPGGFHGYPGMPYGGPPGWMPPPGQEYHQPPGPFPMHYQRPPYGPQATQQESSPMPRQQQQQQGPPKPSTPPAAAAAPPAVPVPSKNAQKAAAKVSAPDNDVKTMGVPEPSAPETKQTKTAPSPPVQTKPDMVAALAPASGITQNSAQSKTVPTGPKAGRIVPAVPIQSRGGPKPAAKIPIPVQTTTNTLKQSAAESNTAAVNAALQYQNATQAATAAVAAAMAKLPPLGGQATLQTNDSDKMDNLTKKVNEMRMDDRIRHSRQPGTGGYVAGHRGGRGGGRRGGREPERGLEVPTTDFDFESANAQFKKKDIGKGSIAPGSPLDSPNNAEAPVGLNGSSGADGSLDVVIPAATNTPYNKSSFFDDISSEAKDREEGAESRGREFRGEERRRNMETFGLSSVDGGGRGGFRGRGRGRGGYRGGYGRGGPRGAYRGVRGDGEAAATVAQ